MKTEYAEFEPLEIDRAEELRDIINRAGREKEALVIDPEEDGVTEALPTGMITPSENTNALVRYRRHY